MPLWFNVAQEDIAKRWNCLKRMCKALEPEEAKNDIHFANWFRLYRLVSGLNELRHIHNCSWDFEGCEYSNKPDTPWWIETPQIENLMKCEDPIVFMKDFIKNNVKHFIRQPENHKELVICWMTIKTLQAEKNKELLNYWNERAISAYLDMQRNYIVPSNDFHWGNVLCGYSYSYTIHQARDENNWKKKSNLDSPITSIDFIPKYIERKNDVIDAKVIENGDNEIAGIIDDFLKLNY